MTVALFQEAAARWRVTRHPRWAAVAEAALAKHPERPLVGAGKKKADVEAWFELEAKGDPLDLDRLVRAASATSAADAIDRVNQLAKRDDPRLATRLIGVLEAPPWRANLYKPFVSTVIELFTRTGDVRGREAMADLAPRYKAIIETSVGDWTSTQLARAAQAMATVSPTALPASDEQRLGDLEAQLHVTAPRQKPKTQSDRELLELIHSAPDDDRPRLVFADALMERGDPRGEFIQLQLQRAAGHGTREALRRERALAADKKRLTSWALPLANGGAFNFGRGFVERVELKPATAKKVLGERAWATVREVRGLNGLSNKLTLAFLESPALANVARIEGVNQAVLESLEPKSRPWASLVAHGLPSKALLRALPRLDALSLFPTEALPCPSDLLHGLPIRELKLGFAFLPGAPTPEFFEALPRLETLELQRHQDEPRLTRPLLANVATTLRHLELADPGPEAAALLEPLSLSSLTVVRFNLERSFVELLLATQASLKTLTLAGSTRWVTLPLVREWMKRFGLTRVSVRHHDSWSFSSDGTLELETGTHELPFAWLLEAGLDGVARVTIVERIFQEDPLSFASLANDEAQLAELRRAFDAKGFGLEGP